MTEHEILLCTEHNDLISPAFGQFEKFYYRFAVTKLQYPYFFTNKYHHHDFPQMWYCLSGEYSHVVDDEKYECKEGSLIIVPPSSHHSYLIRENVSAELICLEATFDFFKGMQKEVRTGIIANLFCHHFQEEIGFSRDIFINFHGEERENFEKLLLSLAREDYTREIPTLDSVKSRVAKIFSLPAFALNEISQKKTYDFIRNTLTPMMDSVEFMNKNYSSKIHREELIKISTLCQTDFFRYIKKIVGETYSIYLQMIRINRAKTMISFSTFSFTYIADKCGFGNRTYMGKVFRKYFGYTMTNERAKRDELISQFPHMVITHEFWEK